MAIISIIGTSGVGKSLLTKQLAALTNNPAFFEGEEGTIPAEIFKNIFSKDYTVQRYTYFVGNLKEMLQRAKSIASTGMDCYVDGSSLSPKAILTYEDPSITQTLMHIIAPLDALEPDIHILLIASQAFIANKLKTRKRTFENDRQTLKRAMHIQKAYLHVVDKQENVIVIDRTELDFHNEQDMQSILETIELIKA